MKILLTNDFHNTAAYVIPKPITDGRYKGLHKISAKTVKRLKNTLCGSEECKCGGNFGERNGAYLELVNMDYENNYIIDLRGSNL